jgi:hypothetical protein
MVNPAHVMEQLGESWAPARRTITELGTWGMEGDLFATQ